MVDVVDVESVDDMLWSISDGSACGNNNVWYDRRNGIFSCATATARGIFVIDFIGL